MSRTTNHILLAFAATLLLAPMGPVGKVVSKTGMRFLVWFEPERAMRGTWFDREHPAWLSSPSSTPPNLRYMEKDAFRLLDLGNADARHWVLDSILQHIRENSVLGVFC